MNVSAASFEYLQAYKRKKSLCRLGQGQVKVFAASIADINKALAVKKFTDLKDKMSVYFHQWLNVTDYKIAELFPSI